MSAPAQFVGGWYLGMTFMDKGLEIMKCFKEDENLTNALYDAMSAYIEGDQKTGDEKMAVTKPLFKTAISGCGELAI